MCHSLCCNLIISPDYTYYKTTVNLNTSTKPQIAKQKIRLLVLSHWSGNTQFWRCILQITRFQVGKVVVSNSFNKTESFLASFSSGPVRFLMTILDKLSLGSEMSF